MTPEYPANVLLLLAEGFEDLEAVAFLDVCGWTEYRDDMPIVTVTTAGFHEEVHGRFGLSIKPDVLMGRINAKNYAALAVPGGFRSHGYDEIYDKEVYDLIRTIHGQGGTIATMCVGILPVAEAGLLKGKHATCYPHSRHDNLAMLKKLGATVADESVVVDDRIISSAGPGLAIEVALLMIDTIVGSEVGDKLRHYMCIKSK